MRSCIPLPKLSLGPWGKVYSHNFNFPASTQTEQKQQQEQGTFRDNNTSLIPTTLLFLDHL